jgi:hypothetical protein
VRARVRHLPSTGTGTWTTLKAGLSGGLRLVVDAGLIDVRTSGEFATRLLRWLGSDCRLDPSQTQMEFAPVGWLGTPINEKDCIVLSGPTRDGRTIQIAVDPDGDPSTTWGALRKAGVIATSAGPSMR